MPDFSSAGEFIGLVVQKVNAYEKKMGQLPEIIVFDSISKVLLDIEGYVLEKVSSYPYGKVNTEIKKIVDFIEKDICAAFDVVLVSHAMYDEETASYKLVNAGGSYGKKGGMLAEVDEAIFIELKGKKRNIHYRNSKMLGRTTEPSLPDNEELTEDFSLQKHIEILREKQSVTEEWSI